MDSKKYLGIMLCRQIGGLLRTQRCYYRSIYSLQETHKEFLDAIKNQGSGELRTCNHDHILEIVISNPQKKNALSGKMIHQFAVLVDELLFSADYYDTVGVILRGDPAGGAFCAGLDFSTAIENAHQPEFAPLMCHLMTDLCTRIQCANVVSVAFINGYALGGGAELCTACDYRMLTAASRIGFVHAKLGASPGWGGGRRLYDIVGRANALLLMGTARVMTAEEAAHVGLGTLVEPESAPSCENDNALAAVYEFLNQFAAMKYPGAVRDLKSLVVSLSVEQSQLVPAQAVTSHQVENECDDTDLSKHLLRPASGTGLLAEAHGSILNSRRVAAEKAIFYKRWGSVENSEALSSKKK